MFQNDLAGIAIVYIYVTILLIITEKNLKKHPTISRKILHILVGNIAFILPIFQTKEIMAFIAAGPFIFFTFLMSPHSPIKSIKGKTSDAGHGMGLVYYSISWTILAYFFFENPVVIAVGILAMSYGDGFASIIGSKYGKRKYKFFGDEKSYIGSLAMFLATIIMMIIAMIFYNYSFSFITIFYLVIIASIAVIIEGISPKGLDNLFVPIIISVIFWYLFIM